MSENTTNQSTNFRRPPRIPLPELHNPEVIIPSPPVERDLNDMGLLASILPVMGISVMAVFYIIRSATGGGDVFFALPMIFIAIFIILGTLVARNVRKQQHDEQRQKEELSYIRLLARREAKLRAANNVQLGVLNQRYPSPESWLLQATKQDMRLWERRSENGDFASVRLGVGRVRSATHIVTPEVNQDNHLLETALQVADEHRYISEAPVVISLQQQVSLGITGNRNKTLSTTRAIITGLATSHSPQELQIALLSSTAHYDDWEWMRWLPHTSSNQQSGAGEYLAFDTTRIRELLGNLSERLDKRLHDEKESKLPLLLLIVDGAHLIENEVLYETIFRHGASVGAAGLCLVKQYAAVPSLAQSVMEIFDDNSFNLITIGHTQTIKGSDADYFSLPNARYTARALSGLNIRTVGASSRVPRRVDFLEMYQVDDITQFHGILDKTWKRIGKKGQLPFGVPIGRESIADTMSVTLNEFNDGSHGILAGTTGAGKSELMQTLICSLAVEHDPRLLNFLLIDFKGGSSFNVFKDLPHTIGMVTNLNSSLVSRALEALRAEIDERQHTLNENNVSDITDYHKRYIRNIQDLGTIDPLPHLFIMVDEFAQLSKQMPEFVKELVNIAQVGRSLGVHLVLGTQSPMEVITEEINANIQFRICLRVQTVEASRAMLRRPDAAYLPLGWPGRGYFQVGEQGVYQEFQTAYVGGDYIPPEAQSKGEEYVLKLLQENGEVHDYFNSNPDDSTPDATSSEDGATKFNTVCQVICDQIVEYSRDNRIRKSSQLLLPPLEETIPLTDVVNLSEMGGWDGSTWKPTEYSEHLRSRIPTGSAPIGYIDDIFNRTQEPLWVHFNRISEQRADLSDGHMLIVGNPGTGKTTVLRTIALSLAVLHSPDDLHMYFLSLTGSGLTDLGNLPHAERVIMGTEEERVRRLFRRLDAEVQRRLDDSSIEKPIIVLFIDQYEQFNEIYATVHFAELARIINQGRGVNIFVVMTASLVRSIPERIRALIQQRIAFEQADKTDYLQVVGRVAGDPSQLPNGRGFIPSNPPLQVQVCQPHLDDERLDNRRTQEALHRAVTRLRITYAAGERTDTKSTELDVLYQQAPASIEILPTEVKLAEIKNRGLSNDPLNIKTIIGKLDNDELEEFELDWQKFGPGFVVSGPPGSGKTNFLHSLIISAAQQFSPEDLRFVLVDFSNQSLYPLRKLKHVIRYKNVSGYVTRPLELKLQIANLKNELENLSKTTRQNEQSKVPATVVVIDDYDTTSEALSFQTTVFQELRNFLQIYRDAGLYIWTAGYLEKRSDELMRQLLLKRAGIIMTDRDYLQKLNIRTIGLSAQLMPRGRAFLPMSEQIAIIQTILIDDVEKRVSILNNQWSSHDDARWLYPAQDEELREEGQAAYSNNSNTSAALQTGEVKAITDEDEDELPAMATTSSAKPLINVSGLLDHLLSGSSDDDDDSDTEEE